MGISSIAIIANIIAAPYFNESFGVYFLLTSIFIGYHFSLKFMMRQLNTTEGNLAQLFWLLIVFTALIIVQFSFIVNRYSLAAFKEPPVNKYLDILYFTTTTFTTVGYGDILPAARTHARILTMVMEIFGVCHAITCFTLLFHSLNNKIKNTAQGA
jgi:hypothetical protein